VRDCCSPPPSGPAGCSPGSVPEQVAVGAFQWARTSPPGGAAAASPVTPETWPGSCPGGREPSWTSSSARGRCGPTPATGARRSGCGPAMSRPCTRRSSGPPTCQENLQAACAEGNGVILALPHCGSWDLAGVWLLGHARQVSVVVQRVRPESLFPELHPGPAAARLRGRAVGRRRRPADRVAGQRLRAGGVVVPVRRPGPHRQRRARVVLRRHHQDAGRGRPTWPPPPGRAAAGRTWFTETGWGMRVHPPVKVNGVEGIPAATQALAECSAPTSPPTRGLAHAAAAVAGRGARPE